MIQQCLDDLIWPTLTIVTYRRSSKLLLSLHRRILCACTVHFYTLCLCTSFPAAADRKKLDLSYDINLCCITTTLLFLYGQFLRFLSIISSSLKIVFGRSDDSKINSLMIYATTRGYKRLVLQPMLRSPDHVGNRESDKLPFNWSQQYFILLYVKTK